MNNFLAKIAMSDWDFLYEMMERGYSVQEIADASTGTLVSWATPLLTKPVSLKRKRKTR